MYIPASLLEQTCGVPYVSLHRRVSAHLLLSCRCFALPFVQRVCRPSGAGLHLRRRAIRRSVLQNAPGNHGRKNSENCPHIDSPEIPWSLRTQYSGLLLYSKALLSASNVYLPQCGFERERERTHPFVPTTGELFKRERERVRILLYALVAQF